MRDRMSGFRAASVIAVAMLFLSPGAASAQNASFQDNSVRRDSAQSNSAVTKWGAIDGSVRDTSGIWLRGVEIVSLDNTQIRTRSGAGGSFRLDSMPAGPHLVRFRRLGIMPLTVSVVVDPNATISVDAVVEPFPITLSRVNVQAVSGELVHLPPGVADRMRTGIGTYLTADQIAKMHPVETKDIFRHVTGVSVVRFAHTTVVRSTRGVQTINGNPCTTGMQVVVDGTIVNNTLTGTSNAAAATGSMDGISPQDIAAIEIYKDGAETPASLRDSECGVIYIWTR
jgi:hypothetical protein